MSQKANRGTTARQENRIVWFIRRAGWWGTTTFLAGMFFLLGGSISLLDGDFSVALQAIVITAVLFAISFYLVMRR